MESVQKGKKVISFQFLLSSLTEFSVSLIFPFPVHGTISNISFSGVYGCMYDQLPLQHSRGCAKMEISFLNMTMAANCSRAVWHSKYVVIKKGGGGITMLTSSQPLPELTSVIRPIEKRPQQISMGKIGGDPKRYPI